MKVLVHCDKCGTIKSVAIPNPRLAGQLSLVVDDDDGTVREIDIDCSSVDVEDINGSRGDDARKAAYARLQKIL